MDPDVAKAIEAARQQRLALRDPSLAPKKKRAAKPKPALDENLDPMAAPTHSLPGIGPAFAEALAEKNLVTVEDLLWVLPRRYDDVRGARASTSLDDVADGDRVTFIGAVISARMIFARGRRWAEVRIEGGVVVRWFNVWAGIEKRMPPGSRVVLSGVMKRRGGHPELANPDVLGITSEPTLESSGAEGRRGSIEGSAKDVPQVIPRYPDVPGVPAARLRSACAAANARVGASAEDGVPAHIEQAAQLPSLPATLAMLHAPPGDVAPEVLESLNAGTSVWQRRLAFGELFSLGVSVAMRRRERRSDVAVACPMKPGFFDELARTIPFKLTKAQHRAVAEVGGDLAQTTPMNRLLQGDVGSGKTAVAFAAALQVSRAGRQTAVMAPTELLAEQHFETWKRWTGLRIELLTASTPKGIRASLLSLLAGGQIDVLVGTHALLAEGVGFHALGLVIIDEQHRFGVAQRARLRDKGDGQGAPHLLVMTATPIPRTLALTAYGDLDTSILDELPPGRTPITTKHATGAKGHSGALKLVAERVAAGERVYIVCPKVEATEDAGAMNGRVLTNATDTARGYQKALPAVRVGLLHARLDNEERDRTMRAFKAGELDVLVATTVIEVGVDVPEATLIVIYDADRFGLAQLHQLRGRVGRGARPGQCILLSQGGLGDDAESRLSIIEQTTDGFRIAEEDLLIRGPGELLGPRQAGIPRLRFGDLAAHTALLLEARGHAERILDEDPELTAPEHAPLRRAIARRVARHVYGAEAG